MNRAMRPDEAQDRLSSSAYSWLGAAQWALETVAAMRVEEDWGLVDWTTNGGKYEKRRRTRLVSEWVDDE